MSKLKILFQQVLMISTGTIFMVGINGIVSYLTGTSFEFPWYYPFSIIFLGISCALPTSLLILNDESKKKRSFIWNLILHWLSVWVIVAMIGWVFNWYFTLGQFLQITVEYIAVYVFVWAATLWLLREEDKKINQALKDIQDEE